MTPSTQPGKGVDQLIHPKFGPVGPDDLPPGHPLSKLKETAVGKADEIGTDVTAGDGKPITINLTMPGVDEAKGQSIANALKDSLKDGVKDVREGGGQDGRESGEEATRKRGGNDDKDGGKGAEDDGDDAPGVGKSGKLGDDGEGGGREVTPDLVDKVDGKTEGKPGDGKPDLYLVDDDTIIWEVDGVMLELTVNFDNIPGDAGHSEEIVLNIAYPEADADARPTGPYGGPGFRGTSDLDAIGTITGGNETGLSGLQNTGSDAFIL